MTITKDETFLLVGEADTSSDAIKFIIRHKPDLAIVECLLSGDGGIHVSRSVRSRGIRTRTVIVADEVWGEDVYQAFTAGSAGYLTLHEPVENLKKYFHDVLNGEVVISNEAKASLQSYIQKRDAVSSLKISGRPKVQLSETERQVIVHCAKGLSISDTAHLMNLSVSTVKNHRQNAFAKLNVHNSPAAIYVALRQGIIH